jgi:hypothetical protein
MDFRPGLDGGREKGSKNQAFFFNSYLALTFPTAKNLCPWRMNGYLQDVNVGLFRTVNKDINR